MSQMGLVSRVTPVHTAVRNCTRDEGRSFEVGNQVLISSHRKLLSRWLPMTTRAMRRWATSSLGGDARLDDRNLVGANPFCGARRSAKILRADASIHASHAWIALALRRLENLPSQQSVSQTMQERALGRS
jgi:hypothetical protein